VQLQWLPFELNPPMPSEGIERKPYCSRKFGSWERSQAIDAQTVLSGKAEGAVFNYEAIKRTQTPSRHIASPGWPNEGADSVRAAHAHGIQSVPHFEIGGIELVGAQPAGAIRQAILKAVGQFAPCSAARTEPEKGAQP
jgi:predicted DsbA family dithiol-disulfide isomerase